MTYADLRSPHLLWGVVPSFGCEDVCRQTNQFGRERPESGTRACRLHTPSLGWVRPVSTLVCCGRDWTAREKRETHTHQSLSQDDAAAPGWTDRHT